MLLWSLGVLDMRGSKVHLTVAEGFPGPRKDRTEVESTGFPVPRALEGSKKRNPQFWTPIPLWCRLWSPEVDPFFWILPGLSVVAAG